MFLLDSLYKGTRLADPEEFLESAKTSLRECADSAMILDQLSQDLLSMRRESVTRELNIAYKHLSFPQG